MSSIRRRSEYNCFPLITVFRSFLAPALLAFCLFFFNDTATTEIYTLSLHDALPICITTAKCPTCFSRSSGYRGPITDRKSTRLNSSHSQISYAVFCLKKKKSQDGIIRRSAEYSTLATSVPRRVDCRTQRHSK